MTPPFHALLRALRAVLGKDAAAFLDHPGAVRPAQAHVLTLSPGRTQTAPGAGAEAEAFLIKKTVFDVALNSAAPCWFVFTEPRYRGSVPKYGRMPEEAPSVWDEPGLLAPALKERAAAREIRKTDAHAMEDRVWRQWALLVTPREIDYETLLRASARPGRELFCLQPGVPIVVLPTVPDGACALLARDDAELAPLLPLLRAWMPEPAGRRASRSPEPARPAAPPRAVPDPDPDYAWDLWYEDLFDRETPRSIDASGRGLVAGLTALWARHLREGGLSRFNLYGGGRSIEIDGDREGARKLRMWTYGDRTTISGGYDRAGDRTLLEKIALAHALHLASDPSGAALCNLAQQSPDRATFERLLDDWIRRPAGT